MANISSACFTADSSMLVRQSLLAVRVRPVRKDRIVQGLERVRIGGVPTRGEHGVVGAGFGVYGYVVLSGSELDDRLYSVEHPLVVVEHADGEVDEEVQVGHDQVEPVLGLDLPQPSHAAAFDAGFDLVVEPSNDAGVRRQVEYFGQRGGVGEEEEREVADDDHQEEVEGVADV